MKGKKKEEKKLERETFGAFFSTAFSLSFLPRKSVLGLFPGILPGRKRKGSEEMQGQGRKKRRQKKKKRG
jgi:hypothetical protein